MSLKGNFFLIVPATLLVAGCAGSDRIAELRQQNVQMRQEKANLAEQLEQCLDDKQQAEEQIETLSGFGGRDRLTQAYGLKNVEIGKYTGLYDKDQDGKAEKLIVYIKPVDNQGDVIKAPGSVNIELWDLNKPQQNALLEKWNIQPGQLKDLWFSALISANYRLTFDLKNLLDDAPKSLTLKVTFTDMLTGKIYQQQILIEK